MAEDRTRNQMMMEGMMMMGGGGGGHTMATVNRIPMRTQSEDQMESGYVERAVPSRIPESDPLEFFSPTLGPEASYDDDEDDILTPLVSPLLTPSRRPQQVMMEEET